MKKGIYIAAFLAVCSLFAYFRLPSLLAHYVAYTFDQGRDFIAGASIILNHKLPFIGPTTGINGLFHGSWWYYLLSIPYILFKGAPIGYYWFNYIVQLLALVFLMLFLKKEYGTVTSLIFGLLITIAPYFNFMSLFVGNNSMVLPSLLVFLTCNYYFFKQDKINPLLFVVAGFSLSLVGEFELSFGIFLIPLYFGGILLFKTLRKVYFQKNGLFFLLGLAIGFTPRILFELKNSLAQTKVLFSFLLKPKLYNSPAPYMNRLSERWILFKEYFFDIFSERFFAYIFLVLILVIAGITVISVIKNKTKINPVLFFYSYILAGLFFLSTLYTDFFWKNYYEGIQYIYIFVFISIIGQLVHKKYIVVKRAIMLSLLLGLTFIGIAQVKSSYNKKVPFDGLQVHEAIVSHILKNQDQSKEYCLRIYTPSVIPHTYNYLFLVNKMNPSSEWVDGTCWFIVEGDYMVVTDSFKSRRTTWLETHMPKDKNIVITKTIKDVEIRYYKVLPK